MFVDSRRAAFVMGPSLQKASLLQCQHFCLLQYLSVVTSNDELLQFGCFYPCWRGAMDGGAIWLVGWLVHHVGQGLCIGKNLAIYRV